MDYKKEKEMLLDIARENIKTNGPFVAGKTAPIVSLVYFGEASKEMILDVFIGEDSGQVIVNSWAVEEEMDRVDPLEDFSNEEIRDIFQAIGWKIN